MKNNTLIHAVLLITFTCMLWSCSEKGQINYAVISGTFLNSDDIEIQIASNDVRFGIDTSSKIELDPEINIEGYFIDTIFLDGVRNFYLSADRNFALFVLKPGDKLEITADISDFDSTLSFSGNAASVNSYLLKKTQLKNTKQKIERAEGFKYDPKAYTKEDTHYEDLMGLLSKSTDLDEEFIENEKMDLKYGYLHAYISTASMNNSQFKDENPQLPANFDALVSSVDLQNIEEYKRSSMYGFLLRTNYNYEYGLTTDPWKTDPIQHLKFLSENVSNQDILNELFIMYGKYDITRTDDVKEYYKFFTEKVTDQVINDAITEQYEDLLATLPGQPSPLFVDYRNYDGTTTSLTDFKGKYVYIDVWATWCGPCKTEIPFLKEVEKNYHDNNIVFVSLSVDREKDFEKWQNFVKEKELGGVQIIADLDFKSEFVEKYQIKGIPHFILIDPEGVIVDQNAPRPSDEKLSELLDGLEL